MHIALIGSSAKFCIYIMQFHIASRASTGMNGMVAAIQQVVKAKPKLAELKVTFNLGETQAFFPNPSNMYVQYHLSQCFILPEPQYCNNLSTASLFRPLSCNFDTQFNTTVLLPLLL